MMTVTIVIEVRGLPGLVVLINHASVQEVLMSSSHASPHMRFGKKLPAFLFLQLFYHACLDAEVMGYADGMALVDGSTVKGDEIA